MAPASSRDATFGAWLGLVPKQESTGDRTILGKISKRGNRYLRTLFVQAALTTSGITEPKDADILYSLGGIFDAPVFIFYRQDTTGKSFTRSCGGGFQRRFFAAWALRIT